MIKVIRVTFVLVLECVKEVEDVKAERSCGTIGRCWKQIRVEELDAFGRGAETTTVTDDEAVSSG